MAFNPLKEKGIPDEQQVKNWDELNVDPYDKNEVHPYTRTRIILMNGIEVEAALFGHQMARHADDYSLKQKLALVRRIEQQQQKLINWLIPADESALEVTLGYEQVAVDLTAWLARTEPDENVKNALDFALIEDFDHLYRYSNLMGVVDGKDPAARRRRADGDLPRPAHHCRAPPPVRFHPQSLRQGQGQDADEAARPDHRRRRAADHELLHERRQPPGPDGRSRPVPGDRPDRRAARLALRVAGRPARDLVRAAPAARVQRMLSLLFLCSGGDGRAHQGHLAKSVGL